MRIKKLKFAQERFSNETAGCFSGETTPKNLLLLWRNNAPRFFGETIYRLSYQGKAETAEGAPQIAGVSVRSPMTQQKTSLNHDSWAADFPEIATRTTSGRQQLFRRMYRAIGCRSGDVDQISGVA